MPTLPQIFRVHQTFEGPRLEDIPGRSTANCAGCTGRTVRRGQSVAVTAGSRGIANIVAILRPAVEHLRNWRTALLVPAMGSHGGGTADGQRQLLESYGITELAVGFPIRSSTETVVVGRAAEGFPLDFIARRWKPTTCWSATASSRTPTSPPRSKAG